MGKAERTRQHIIETAAPLFNRKGVAGTTIDDVLEVTKMAKGGLYGHFTNKEALAYEMVDHLLQKITSETRNAIESQTSAKLKLFAMLDLYKDTLNPVIEGGSPILNFGVESDDTDAFIRIKVKTVIQAALKNIAAIVSKGIENGEFSADFNGEEFAVKMFTLIEGGMMIGRVLRSNKQMKMMTEMLKKEIEAYVV